MAVVTASELTAPAAVVAALERYRETGGVADLEALIKLVDGCGEKWERAARVAGDDVAVAFLRTFPGRVGALDGGDVSRDTSLRMLLRERELAALRAVAAGVEVREIARQAHVHRHVLDDRLRTAASRLGASSVAEAAAYVAGPAGRVEGGVDFGLIT